ncbi:MAG: hypothetical protein ACR2HX_22340 [Pyrinomonadaceae bacterium]
MNVIDLRFKGIWVSLSGTDDLEVRCSRPLTAEEKALIVEHKTALLAELGPATGEVVAQLVARGFRQDTAASMSLLEATTWLARDGGSSWLN